MVVKADTKLNCYTLFFFFELVLNCYTLNWNEIGVEQGDGDTSSLKENSCPPYSPSLSSSLSSPLLSQQLYITSHHIT